MNTRFPNLPHEGDSAEDKIVYVRSVAVADLPEEVQTQVEGLDHIYSLNNADGTRLALVANRTLAFALAREHDYAPVNVH